MVRVFDVKKTWKTKEEREEGEREREEQNHPIGEAQPGLTRVTLLLSPPLGQQPQTLGPALRAMLPSLFPSSRDPVLAHVVLHGAPVPFSAPLEELMREAAYPDGWLCLIVVLL